MFKRFFSIVFLLLLLVPYSNSEVSANDLKFTVSPIISSNQSQNISTYFNLDVQPGTTEHLQIQIKNHTDEETTINIFPTNALTTKNGGIEYTKKSNTENSSFIDPSFAIAKQIDIQKQVKLKPNESKIVDFTVTTPKNKNGTFLGGLLFEKEEIDSVETVKQEQGASFNLEHKSAFAMAIQLNMPDNAKDKFSFGESKMTYHTSGMELMFEFKNENSTILNLNKIEYKVMNRKDKMMFSGDLHNIKLAPMNELKYPLYWNGKPIAEGTYKVELTTKIGGKEIVKVSEFDVERKDLVEQINKIDKSKSQILVQEHTPVWIWVLVAILVLAVSAMSFYILKKRKDESEQNGNE